MKSQNPQIKITTHFNLAFRYKLYYLKDAKSLKRLRADG
jgi:hypothetical protein